MSQGGTVSFERACAPLRVLLSGTMRQALVDEWMSSTSRDRRAPLERLRDALRLHRFTAGGQTVDFGAMVKSYDRLTRLDGFHALNDWDGKADRVNADIIPVDVLHYVLRLRQQAGTTVSEALERTALAVLFDYYVVHLLSLLTLRLWDEGDPDAHLDEVERLLQLLQGEGGSGQRFSADAETLLLIATSHFELHEWGYAKLLARTRTLNREHRVRVAVGHASSMGSHLRFGFEATYGRDTVVMRNDNVADYPWLCFALATVVGEYDRIAAAGEADAEREVLVEALLNGLTPDARAFLGAPPTSLSEAERERLELVGTLERYKVDLLPQFERFRPSTTGYSPIAFFFNFSHNVVKGAVVDTLLTGRVWPVTLNDLLTSRDIGAATANTKLALVHTLMAYARANPDTIRGKPKPVIVYDAAAGRQAFGITLRKLRE